MIDIQLKRTEQDVNIGNTTYKEGEPSVSLDRKKLYVEGNYIGGQNTINVNGDYTPVHLDYCMVDVRTKNITITLPTLEKDFILFLEDCFNAASENNYIKIVSNDSTVKINGGFDPFIINEPGIVAHITYSHATKSWKIFHINDLYLSKPGINIWSTKTYAGKTEYEMLGKKFPSNNKNEYLLTLGGVIIDPSEYTIDVLKRKIIFDPSVTLEDNLALTLRYWIIGVDGVGCITLPLATLGKSGAIMPDGVTLAVDDFGVLKVINATGVVDATEAIKGIAKIATQVESEDINNDVDYITPKKYWNNISRSGIESWQFTSDGSAVDYTLPNVTINDINELFVIGGRLQLIPTVDYTYSSNTLTLKNTLPAGTVIHVRKLTQTLVTSSLNIQAQVAAGLTLYTNYSGAL